jgi:integrase
MPSGLANSGGFGARVSRSPTPAPATRLVDGNIYTAGDLNPGTLRPRAVTDGFEERTLSRRRHQEGQLLKLQHGWAVRFYEDFLDKGVRQRHRVQKYLGDFAKLPTKRSAQNAMQQELALVNNFHAQLRTTQTFRQQAAVWIADCKKRQWKPIRPSVLRNWQGALNNHILPVLGSKALSDVRNGAMRTLVEWLSTKGGLKPGSIKGCMQVVKSVVASAVNDDGDGLFPVVWNARFIKAPAINWATQRRPTFTTEELNQLVKGTTGRLQMAVILLAASGLRVGELLGLECRHFDGRGLRIEQAVWNCKVQPPKTVNAYRTVDLHGDVAALLKQFIANRTAGFIFSTRTDRAISTRNFARLLYSSLKGLYIPKRGFHAFRRFRNTHLRNTHCPPGVLRYWMGHAPGSMSDIYDQSCVDAEFRRDIVRDAGTGFDVPERTSVRKHRPKAPKQAQRKERALSDVMSEAEAAVNY